MRDHLKALQGLVIIGLVGTGLVVAAGVWEMVTAAPIHTTVYIDGLNQVALPEGVKAAGVSQIGVEIASPTGRQRLLHALTQAPTTLLLLTAMAMLVVLLKRIRRTEPFTPHTVRMLRIIGVTLAAGVLAVAIEGAAQLLLSETITPQRPSAVFEIPFVWLLGAFLCFSIAEVIRHGTAMRDDLATVI